MYSSTITRRGSEEDEAHPGRPPHCLRWLGGNGLHQPWAPERFVLTEPDLHQDCIRDCQGQFAAGLVITKPNSRFTKCESLFPEQHDFQWFYKSQNPI